MKAMHSFVRLGANRSHSLFYGEDLQRRMADEGAVSCIETYEVACARAVATWCCSTGPHGPSPVCWHAWRWSHFATARVKNGPSCCSPRQRPSCRATGWATPCRPCAACWNQRERWFDSPPLSLAVQNLPAGVPNTESGFGNGQGVQQRAQQQPVGAERRPHRHLRRQTKCPAAAAGNASTGIALPWYADTEISKHESASSTRLQR